MIAPVVYGSFEGEFTIVGNLVKIGYCSNTLDNERVGLRWVPLFLVCADRSECMGG